MNVFDILKQDHQAVRELLSQIERTEAESIGEREDLFGRLRHELIAHAHAEERLFYPSILDKPQLSSRAHDEVEDGIREHHRMENMLSRLDNIPVDAPEWLPELQELKACIEHHIQEEEAEIFPQAANLLPHDQAEQMAGRLQVVKAEEERALD